MRQLSEMNLKMEMMKRFCVTEQFNDNYSYILRYTIRAKRFVWYGGRVVVRHYGNACMHELLLLV